MQTSTVKARRFLTMCASSVGVASLREQMNQPWQRQRRQQEDDQQRHHGRHASILKVDPDLHRHTAWIVSGDHDRAELAKCAYPGNAECSREAELGQRKSDTTKNLQRRQT